MARQPLGRGLSALLGEDAGDAAEVVAPEIDIDLIEPNPEQPRTQFTEQNLDELAQSIRSNGIVQPIVVRRKDGRHQIVAGERRWRAAQRAGLRKVPVVVRDIPDEKLLEIALVENIQRQELNPIEEAKAYRKLIDTVGLTQDMLAERVGKDRTVVTTTLRLLKLPQHIQDHIAAGRLSSGHGRALLMTDELRIQNLVANSVLSMGLSVRETEKAVKRLITKGLPTDTPKEKPPVDANVKQAEVKLMRKFSTRVRIVPKGKAGGKIELEYNGAEDLDRIYSLLMDRQ